jgi:hypothetical protein
LTVSAQSGPLVIYGQNTAPAGGVPDYNQDVGPSAIALGLMALDPRYGYKGDLVSGSQETMGWYQAVDYMVVDQIPSTAAVANLAAAQATTAGTPMTLVAATGAGITVTTAVSTMQPAGTTVPIGGHYIDGPTSLVEFGPSGAVGAYDPRTMLSRALSVTATGGTGGAVILRGLDVYGVPVTGAKGFKVLLSATPAVSSAGTYSIGTADIFEFPIAVYANYFLQQADTYWIGAFISAVTGFVGASVTTPATATSGSVRGTYAVQSASNGTNRLQMLVNVMPQNAGAAYGIASWFGVPNYAA